MDWTLALQRNHSILLRLMAVMFVMAGLKEGQSVETLPRWKRLVILRILRPAESAYRRVIMVAVFVYQITAPAYVERTAGAKRRSKDQSKSKSKSSGQAKAAPSFPLIDRRKNFDERKPPQRAPGAGPWISSLGSGAPVQDRAAIYAAQEALRNKRAPSDEDDLSAKSLCDRLNALKAALDDLPGQALRLVKLRERLQRRFEKYGKPNLPPMRPGNPPGFRQRQTHEVDELLAECHRLAMRVENAPPLLDTS